MSSSPTNSILEKHNSPPAMYDNVPIHELNTNDFIPLVIRELMKEAYTPPHKLSEIEEGSEEYEHRLDLNARVEKAWARLDGTLFEYTEPTVPFAHGAPGHGKTTSIRVAAKMFAEMVGLNFVDRPTDDFKPGRNDMLLVLQELAGEVSSITQGGLTIKDQDEDGTIFMRKVPLKQIQMANDAGFSLMVYDDVKNAGPSIQNILLAIMEERAFQGNKLGHTAVAATGNLGSVDGTKISQLSTANMTRCQNYLVYDTVKNYVARNASSQNGKANIGADMVCGFLWRNPDLFTETPGSQKVPGTYASPRTWSKLMTQLQDMVGSYLQKERRINSDLKDPQLRAEVAKLAELRGEPTDEASLQSLVDQTAGRFKSELSKLHSQISAKVKGIIGIHEAGRSFSEYVVNRLKFGTDIMAELIVKNGELNAAQSDKFVSRYSGMSGEAKMFGHYMSMSMADAVALPLAQAVKDGDHKRIEELGQRFAKGVLAPADVTMDGQKFSVGLEEDEVTRALYFMVNKSSSLIKDPRQIKITDAGYILNNSLLKSFVTGIAQEPMARAPVNPAKPGGIKKYDLIANILTNQKTSADIELDAIMDVLEKAQTEKAVTAQESQTLSNKPESQPKQPAPAAQQSTPAGAEAQPAGKAPEPAATQKPQQSKVADLPDPNPTLMPEQIDEAPAKAEPAKAEQSNDDMTFDMTFDMSFEPDIEPKKQKAEELESGIDEPDIWERPSSGIGR